MNQYNSETKDGGLFTDYINAFLKLKTTSNGWPKWCNTDEKKQQCINDYYKIEGVQLNGKKWLNIKHRKVFLN